MKLRKGFIVGMVSLLGVTALAGCKKKEDAKLTKVSINGVQRTYEVGDSIAWDSLRVTATYSDSSTQTFSRFEYDVTAVTKADTEAVIYTSGLHEQATAEEGVYAITVALPSDLSTKYNAGNIAVGNATPDSYALVECSDPTLKTGYTTNIRDAGTDPEPERNDKTAAKANENKFIGSQTQYVVGTMNPFVYEPEVSFENLADPTADLISGDDIHFRKNYVVKVKSNNEYVEAPAADYTIVNGNVKFNESAIGKTFSLTVSLADFATVEGTTKKAESTFEGFTVQKGLNIYNAKQLGILNITKYTTAQLAEKKFVEHGDSDEMWWDGTNYQKPMVNEIWAQFLTQTGTFTTEELQAYADTPAIFLQRKLEIEPSDFPSGYFVQPGELAGDTIVGCLRDGVPMYAPIVESTDVEINGNFWTLDTTKIPLCKNERSHNGPKPYSEDAEDQVIMPGHSSLFEFCGMDLPGNQFFENQELTSTGKGIIRNINTIGNTGTDLVSKDFEKMLTLTGLIFVKNDFCGALYENCIIKQYQIGIFGDNMIGQKYNNHEQTDHTFVKDSRMYDCSNSGIFNYHNGGMNVSKSVFNRFGAAPLMNAGSVDENRTSNTKFTPDVIFNNEITGEEIYFSALGATEAVGTIQGFNKLFTAIGNQLVYTVKDANGQDVSVMNLVSIGINGDDYLEADSANYYSNVQLNAGANNQLNASVKAQTAQWGLFSDTKDIVHDALLDDNYKKIEAAYKAAYDEGWATATASHDAAYKAAYEENYAAGWALAQQQYAAAEKDTKDQVARGYIASQYSIDPADVTPEQIAIVEADDTFNAYFEANYRAAIDAGFEEQAGFAYNETAYLAYFNAQFEAGFEAQAGFAYNEEAFKEYFDPQFEAGFQNEMGFPFPHSKAEFEPYFNYSFEQDYEQPPVFQTEVSSELFWTDTNSLYDAQSKPFTTTLDGNYLHLLAPVGNTCLSLVFRISKLPTPTLA